MLSNISWPSLATSWVVVQKIYSKMYLLVSSTNNIHHDVTDSVNHGMFENTKTWITWEQKIIFLRNKKILNLCLRMTQYFEKLSFCSRGTLQFFSTFFSEIYYLRLFRPVALTKIQLFNYRKDLIIISCLTLSFR